MRVQKLFLGLMILCSMLASSPNCWSSPAENPLLRALVFSKNQSIFSYNRLSVGNDFLDRSSYQTFIMPECIVSNTITRKTNLDIDYESYNCNFYFEKSIGNSRFGINSGFVTTGGGVFDSLIESYHQALGLPNGERGGTPENRYSAEGVAKDGRPYQISESDFSIIDPQFSLSVPLDFNKFFTDNLFLDLSATIPTGLGQLGINKPEFKSGVIYLGVLGDKVAFSLGVTGILHLDYKQYGASYDPYSYGGFTSVQYQIFEDSAVFLQNVISSNFESKFTELKNHFWYLDVGLRFLVRDKDLIEVIVRENPSPSAGTVDVSFILRYAVSSF